jgi:hypothetical protein
MSDFREAVAPLVNRPGDADEKEGDEGGDEEAGKKQPEPSLNSDGEIKAGDGEADSETNGKQSPEKSEETFAEVDNPGENFHCAHFSMRRHFGDVLPFLLGTEITHIFFTDCGNDFVGRKVAADGVKEGKKLISALFI